MLRPKGVRMNYGDEGAIGYSTSRGRDWPSVRQFNVFIENRVGALLDVLRQFDSTDIRIISLNIVDSADCAIIRLVLTNPERSLEILQQKGFAVTESDLLVVQLPEGNQGLLQICKALLGAEINIHYAYPLLVGPAGHAALAFHVEDHETAMQNLVSRGFTVLTENDLNS
jgi:hypothetical protein